MMRYLGEPHVLKHDRQVELINGELLIVPRRHQVADEAGRAEGEGIHVVCSHPIDDVRFAHRAALRFCLGRGLQSLTTSRP